MTVHSADWPARKDTEMKMRIVTARLVLRSWTEADRDVFAALHADLEVMADLGGPISRTQSDAKLERYMAAFRQHGICRWAVESGEGGVLGYAGIMPAGPDHPLGPHCEVGWRLARRAWGHGYATEAAAAALTDAFGRACLPKVLAYTAVDNARSRAVVGRLPMRRDPARDFTAVYPDVGAWSGLVWVAAASESGDYRTSPGIELPAIDRPPRQP